MSIINYRPALDHPVYKGGYYFILFWALLDITMTLRHYFLYEGTTPLFFHVFVVLAVVLPLFKRGIVFESSTEKAIYRSNILGEPRKMIFDKPLFEVERDRRVGTLIIKTNKTRFNTQITEIYDNFKDKEVIQIKPTQLVKQFSLKIRSE